MTDVFRSPQLTLIRAQHHIRDFKATVDQFIAEKPWTCFVDKGSLLKIKFTQQIPEMLPCILFDAANNLRAVLDQCGYASAVASKVQTLKAIKFPFGPTECDFRNNLAGGCKDLPPEIRTLFGSFKAYKGGNNTLWALNEIANTKKHLALKPLVITGPSVFFTGKITKADGSIAEVVSPGGFGIGWDSEKGEVTLMSTLAGSNFDVNANVTFDVAIEGIETLGSKSTIAVLEAMRSEVERVLEDTKAECRSLGIA